MDMMNGVVNIATGLLLRAGYCDFTKEHNFNPNIEAQHGDVPSPCYIVNEIPPEPASDMVTHWTGEGWDEVPRVQFVPPEI